MQRSSSTPLPAALAAVLAVIQSFAGAADAEVRKLPNHGVYHCGSANNTTQSIKCSNPINVQVVPVVDAQGRFSTCIAVLPYNKMWVHRTQNVERVTLTWVLPTPGANDIWLAKFSAPGVSLTPQSDERTIDDVFEDAGTVSADKQTFTISMAPGSGAGSDFDLDHLPVIKYTADRTANQPKYKRCFGVDPIIVNSAD